MCSLYAILHNMFVIHFSLDDNKATEDELKYNITLFQFFL